MSSQKLNEDQMSTDLQRPTVTQKQVMSHHFGFGNIQVEKVGTSSIKNKATGLEASGKYQEFLVMKQRDLEKQMMVNRLQKLKKEEDRLQKECEKAMQMTQKHQETSMRKEQDDKNRQDWLDNREATRQWNLQNNTSNRNNTRRSIYENRKAVLNANIFSRATAKSDTDHNNQTINNFRNQDLNNKQMNASNQYQNRCQASMNSKDNKEKYLQSIVRINQQQKFEHSIKKDMHEGTLNKLQQIEERLIGDLQRTLQRKNQAQDILAQRSPALKKAMQPRLAYNYRKKPGESGYMTQTQGFGANSSNQLLGRDMNNSSELRHKDQNENRSEA